MAVPKSRVTELRYDASKIELKWQKRWEEDELYKVRDTAAGQKWYELTMYPYPSGDLHIGHWYAMAPADAHARFKRMQGYNVLHPMGFDAFGLPAENAAIREGIHPRVRTMDNISNMRQQLRRMGTMYDWDREIVTCSPDYYRWNQWIFLQFYKNDLAYRAYAPANWCPKDNTVLANEQVVDGKCERCDSMVERRELNQWFFRVTKYADELLDHSQIQWPEKINTMQTNWIGRSEGVDVEFDISEYGLKEKVLTTFTTRIDTIYGVTFVVLAPEHPLVEILTTPENKEAVDNYIVQARRQSEVERLSTDKAKTGVYTGAYCINPLNGRRIPILVADYVLRTYGTGVVMAVPAHDERDFKFAKKYGLPIEIVVSPDEWNGEELSTAYTGEGVQVNSEQFDGLHNTESISKIADYIESKGWGRRNKAYRIRDWLISRQRYWGTPIPIVYCDSCGTVPVEEDDLPVTLPDDAEFKPTGESPLKLNECFWRTECPSCGGIAIRETDTMDTFVDSSWYQFRFTSSGYAKGIFDPDLVSTWSPVDQYTGGAEHAVMHLLYARFFTKALRDLGLLDFDEPFIRLFNQGHIIANHQKMSKSRGNVIAPDKYVRRVGADAVRCYLMFLGPWDRGGDWSDTGLNGMVRWINRVWDLASRDLKFLKDTSIDGKAVADLNRMKHKTIRRVVSDMEQFKFNTVLASLMEYSNELNMVLERKSVDVKSWTDAVEKLLILMAPITPHISEELWSQFGHETSIHLEKLPDWDPELSSDDVITLVVQVNGRLRDRIEIPAESVTEEEAVKLAKESDKVIPHIRGKVIKREIYVPAKLVNIVI